MMTYEDERAHDNFGRATWFAAGLLFGAGVALLVAPASGIDNRQFLKRKARRFGNYVADESGAFINSQRDRMNRIMERGREEVGAIGEHANAAMEHGRSAYRAARDEVQGVASDAKKAVTNAVQGTEGRRQPSQPTS